jgi:succinate dehydrogenase (ubiquinone) membrane anchor subunit
MNHRLIPTSLLRSNIPCSAVIRPTLGTCMPRIIRYSSTTASTTTGPSPMHGSYHWVFERAVAVTNMGLLTSMIFAPASLYSLIDFGLVFALPLHGYLGINAIITDYLPRRKFPIVYPIVKGLWAALSILVTYGLYQFTTNSIGISAFIKKIWTIRDSKSME